MCLVSFCSGVTLWADWVWHRFFPWQAVDFPEPLLADLRLALQLGLAFFATLIGLTMFVGLATFSPAFRKSRAGLFTGILLLPSLTLFCFLIYSLQSVFCGVQARPKPEITLTHSEVRRHLTSRDHLHF